MNLKDFLYSALQFTLMKHTSRKYSIFQSQELRSLELTRSLITTVKKYGASFTLTSSTMN